MNRLMTSAAVVLALLAVFVSLPSDAEAAPSRYRKPFLVDLDDPESVLEVLSRLERMRYTDFAYPKRGVDFGLGRGYSGSQAAKHLMGLAAANYAIGPGRKRRESEEYSAPEAASDNTNA